MTFISVVPRDVVELTPLSSVFLRLPITLLFLHLGLALLRLAFLSLSMLLPLTLLLEFLLNFDYISIRKSK
jgi:hypothetical protein